jgi:hypothetical protein
MPDSTNARNKIQFIAIVIIVCGFILGVRDALFRELWFDEALTIGQFMELPTIGAVYRSYVIPNNHIVYTIFLKIWNYLNSTSFSLDFYWRLFTVLTAGITVGIMACRWRKRYGLIAVVPVLFAFTYSLPFEIYATAIRGYMLSMLWIIACLEFARGWVFKGSWRNGLGYFIFCLLAVGTIPSNLLALGAIAIIFFPYFGFKKVFSSKFIYLALAPLAATTLFYLPLSRNVAKILKLHEGWESGFSVLKVIYSSLLVAFSPLIIAALFGGIVYLRNRKHRKFLWYLLILLIPVPIVFLRSPAPFPRVFITLWPLWILLFCAGTRHFLAVCRLHGNKHFFAAIFLLVASLLWGIFWHNYRTLGARVFHEEHHLDDYFAPYYMAPEYKPWNLVQKIKKTAGENDIPVYITFGAEPYVIALYGRMAGISPQRWVFDNPRGKVMYLPAGSWILLKTRELPKGKLKEIKKRFGIKNIRPLFEEGVYSVFEFTN